MSTDKRMKEMWYAHTMEFYSTLKLKGMLPFAIMWIDLEDIMPNEMLVTEEQILA